MKHTDFIASLLWVLEKLLIVVACVSFLMGGFILHQETSMSRLSGELIGIGIAFACWYLARRANFLFKKFIKENKDFSTTSLS